MPRTTLFKHKSLLYILLLVTTLLWILFGYQREPQITSIRGSSLRPVIVEHIWFDDRTWSAQNGVYYANPCMPPAAGGGGAGLAPQNLPFKAEARWYDPVQQCIYEAVLLDPDMPQKAAAVLKAQPGPYQGRYNLQLVPFLRGSDLEIWLHGSDHNFPNSQKFTELLSVAHGHVVSGDTAKYTAAVEMLIKGEKIPADTPLPGSKE